MNTPLLDEDECNTRNQEEAQETFDEVPGFEGTMEALDNLVAEAKRLTEADLQATNPVY